LIRNRNIYGLHLLGLASEPNHIHSLGVVLVSDVGIQDGAILRPELTMPIVAAIVTWPRYGVRKKEIPCTEGVIKNISAHVRYTILY